MKHVCTTICALLLVAGLSQAAENVPSKNAVGYVKVNVLPSGSPNLVALNFRAVGGADLTLQEVFGTNQLTQAIVPTQADRVFIWNEAIQEYTIFFQSTDGLFRHATNAFGPSVDVSVTPGRPMWISSPGSQTLTNEVFLMGEVVGAASSSQDLLAGLNMLNSSFAAELAVTNNDWLAEGATGGVVPTQGDRLFVWNGVDGYTIYFLKGDGTWRYATNAFGAAVSPEIPVGAGAWYEARNNFTNNLDRPYTYPAD